MPIKIDWKGQSLTISDNEIFAVGAEIEEIVTLPELVAMAQKPKTFKLAEAYAAMINFAGGSATKQDVHKAMMAEMAGGDGHQSASDAINTLLTIIMDGALSEDSGGKPVEKK